MLYLTINLERVLYALIATPLTLFLLTIVLSSIITVMGWIRDPQKNSPKPVEGIPSKK